MDIKTLQFEIHELVVNAFLTDELLADMHSSQVREYLQYNLRHMAHQLTAVLRVPGQKLPRVRVASYPATWWDHLKARLGWKHRKMEVYREDLAVIPSIPLPPHHATVVRIMTHYGLPELAA